MHDLYLAACAFVYSSLNPQLIQAYRNLQTEFKFKDKFKDKIFKTTYLHNGIYYVGEHNSFNQRDGNIVSYSSKLGISL